MDFGKVFNTVAADYDRHRPIYPDDLIDVAMERAVLRAGDPVLEIGCGTGQLTQALVERGLDVTAVEPGANLLELARTKLADANTVRFVNAKFEESELPAAAYKAVFSARAGSRRGAV